VAPVTARSTTVDSPGSGKNQNQPPHQADLHHRHGRRSVRISRYRPFGNTVDPATVARCGSDFVTTSVAICVADDWSMCAWLSDDDLDVGVTASVIAPAKAK
jgi:hypothetical protein